MWVLLEISWIVSLVGHVGHPCLKEDFVKKPAAAAPPAAAPPAPAPAPRPVDDVPSKASGALELKRSSQFFISDFLTDCVKLKLYLVLN